MGKIDANVLYTSLLKVESIKYHIVLVSQRTINLKTYSCDKMTKNMFGLYLV